MSNIDFRINDQIKAKEVRLIDSNGNMVGVVPTFKALNMARNESLDLVEVSPNESLPVCKIADYGKIRYQNQKKMSEAKKKQKVVELKEIKFSINIAENDYNTKMRQAKSFFEEGNKVKFTFQFRGREISHTDLADEMINKIVEELVDYAKIDKAPALEGKKKSFTMVSIVKKTNK